MDDTYHFFIKKKESGSKYILYHDQTCFIANNCSLLMGFVLLIFLVCVVQLCVFTFWVPCCDARYDSAWKWCSVYLCLQLFVGGLISYLRCLCLFACSCVQHILCCVFLLIVCPVLPVSLDCPFLIPLLFSLMFI